MTELLPIDLPYAPNCFLCFTGCGVGIEAFGIPIIDIKLRKSDWRKPDLWKSDLRKLDICKSDLCKSDFRTVHIQNLNSEQIYFHSK
jgi:uncharacterized protein YjbI with pentapeptide repeats